MSLNNVINFPQNQDECFQEAMEFFNDQTAQIALEKLIALIDSGNNDAYAFVGAVYEIGGKGIDIDYDKALFYYKKAIEEAGSIHAYQALGRMYYFGLGVEKDYVAAFNYYNTIDKETEDAISSLMLGQSYYYGNGIEKNLERAKQYYMKAINLGNVHAITRMAILESEAGNVFNSIIMRLKALCLTIKLMLRDSNDIRLRYY